MILSAGLLGQTALGQDDPAVSRKPVGNAKKNPIARPNPQAQPGRDTAAGEVHVADEAFSGMIVVNGKVMKTKDRKQYEAWEKQFGIGAAKQPGGAGPFVGVISINGENRQITDRREFDREVGRMRQRMRLQLDGLRRGAGLPRDAEIALPGYDTGLVVRFSAAAPAQKLRQELKRRLASADQPNTPRQLSRDLLIAEAASEITLRFLHPNDAQALADQIVLAVNQQRQAGVKLADHAAIGDKHVTVRLDDAKPAEQFGDLCIRLVGRLAAPTPAPAGGSSLVTVGVADQYIIVHFPDAKYMELGKQLIIE